MKKKFLSAIFSVMLCFGGGSATASIISGTHTTDGGKLVNLQGLEWLSWDVTMGVSRTSIEAGFGGFLADGWRYATRQELSNLFLSLSPQSGYNVANKDGSMWLWENFDNPSFLAPASGYYSRNGDLFVGADGECNANLGVSCAAHWRAYTGPGNTSGWFYDSYGRTPSSYTLSESHLGGGSGINITNGIASVLVRASEVPEPASIALVCLGLLGLAGSRRRFNR